MEKNGKKWEKTQPERGKKSNNSHVKKSTNKMRAKKEKKRPSNKRLSNYQRQIRNRMQMSEGCDG